MSKEDKNKKLKTSGVTSELIRKNIRQKFFRHLKAARQSLLNMGRPGLNSNVSLNTVEDLRSILLKDKELNSVLAVDEIEDVYNEIKQEISSKFSNEADMYEYSEETELQKLLQVVLTECDICGELNPNVVCSDCASDHFD